jgi:hypothetical protein
MDIIVLDALAVAGGSASRDALFRMAEPSIWGYMADSVGGKEAAFDGAVRRLLDQQAIVPWDNNFYALHPTKRLPRVPGGKPYVPGSSHWKNERDLLASEVHQQLAAYEERERNELERFLEAFTPQRARLIELVKRQIQRGQLADETLDEMVLTLSRMRLEIGELATALDMSVQEIASALARASKPKPIRGARRKRPGSDRQATASGEIEQSLAEGVETATPVDHRRLRARGHKGSTPWDPPKLAQYIREHGGVLSRSDIIVVVPMLSRSKA